MTEIPYVGEIVTGLVSFAVATGLAWNKIRRDKSKTDLQSATDDVAESFTKNLLSEYRSSNERLKDAERERAVNAEKIGALTAQVGLLRDQVSEVRKVLDSVSLKLDEANSDIHKLRRELAIKEGDIIRIAAEKEAAIQRAIRAERRDEEAESRASRAEESLRRCRGGLTGEST